MKKFAVVILLLAVVFALLQLARPGIPSQPATAEVQALPEVRQVLEKSCYSCHSDERKLAWFDEIVPAYWLVRHDVLTAREHLNFSTLGSKPAAAQRATLFEAVNMIQLGAMPLPAFRAMHPEARMTPEELAVLKNYLAPWGVPPPHAAAAPQNATQAPANLAAMQPEFNGLAFDASFEGWKLLSITDRGDNNTLRVILGNEIAFQAVQQGSLSPWPDGARIAKIAWQQQTGEDGLIHPGGFVQVELMVKDHARYKDTEGWGWGRWRGLGLTPYGKDAAFVKECTSCHLPVRGNDYVYTLPITSAAVSGVEITNRRAAALPASLPSQPLGWNVITTYVDPARRTTAVLFGNDEAMKAVHAPGPMGQAAQYPTGATLALVTWTQRDDPHWFGARIPDAPLSVEFVHAGAAGELNGYRRFAGTGLAEEHAAATDVKERATFMTTLTLAQLP
jgi:Haem-binding domain/Cytochrome P460